MLSHSQQASYRLQQRDCNKETALTAAVSGQWSRLGSQNTLRTRKAALQSWPCIKQAQTAAARCGWIGGERLEMACRISSHLCCSSNYSATDTDLLQLCQGLLSPCQSCPAGHPSRSCPALLSTALTQQVFKLSGDNTLDHTSERVLLMTTLQVTASRHQASKSEQKQLSCASVQSW